MAGYGGNYSGGGMKKSKGGKKGYKGDKSKAGGGVYASSSGPDMAAPYSKDKTGSKKK